jgi:hypothetical protein
MSLSYKGEHTKEKFLRSSEAWVLRLEDGWLDDGQPIEIQEVERASQKHVPPVSKEVEKLQEAARSFY